MDLEVPGKPARRRIGPLEAVDFPGKKGSPTIVLFHGYGADGADLAPLAREVPQTRPWRWVFPDAAETLDFGGRAWFPIDAQSIERAQRSGKAVDWSGSRPRGLDEALCSAEEFLKELSVPWERLVLGGFSQGSMIALELAFRAPIAPRGLVILSGNLIDEKGARAAAPKLAGVPYFQSHGIADPLLGFALARKLESLLREAGLDGKLLSFEGGHAITPEVVADLGLFLDARSAIL